MIRTILESSDHAEKVAKRLGAPRRLRHAKKMRYAKKIILLPFLFYVFGHCDLNNGLTEMLRTILELTDYPFKTSAAIDVLKRLRRT